MTETLTGGCLCGALRYRAVPGKRLHYVCHCTDCQRHSGGPFHAAIVVSAADVSFEGTPRVWTKTADSGREIARYFCGDCGGHLCTSPWPEATRYSLKAGTLDDHSLFSPTDQIWCQSEAEWLNDVRSGEPHREGFERQIDIGGSLPIG